MDFSKADSESEDLYQPVFVGEIIKLKWEELNESRPLVLQSTRVENNWVNDDDSVEEKNAEKDESLGKKLWTERRCKIIEVLQM